VEELQTYCLRFTAWTFYFLPARCYHDWCSQNQFINSRWFLAAKASQCIVSPFAWYIRLSVCDKLEHCKNGERYMESL